VLLTDHEYGAMRMLWDEVAGRAGATVTVAALPRSPQHEDELAAAVLDRVTPRTRVVFFSHVTSAAAIVLPAARICAGARAAGALTVVDGAHGPGLLDLDLRAVGADVYVGNAHKWLLAPRGAAFIAANDAAQRWIAGPVVSWGWAWAGERAFQGRFDWPGTFDPTALLCIPQALAIPARARLAGRRRPVSHARRGNLAAPGRRGRGRPRRRQGTAYAADGGGAPAGRRSALAPR
jgi:isopenicillin-N epimerase